MITIKETVRHSPCSVYRLQGFDEQTRMNAEGLVLIARTTLSGANQKDIWVGKKGHWAGIDAERAILNALQAG